jgi:hypothetical protein
MENKNNDALFRDMAGQYAEGYGAALRREAAELARRGVAYNTPELDARVKALTKRARPRAYRYRWLGLAAACLLLVLLPLLRVTRDAPSDAPAPPSDTGLELLALSFTLPENLSVARAEADNGQSVYHLTDARRDDVVMTLEAAYGGFSEDGLRAIPVGGSVAYARSGGDYSLLTFEKDGVRYVLTCRYELDTLVSLGEQIL